ncbi:hypothetical protein BgiMline_013203 [Biomphalaria glabrata]|nr:hypothetical protein BgiMline_017016 [Biomphalaria glabrata]
MFTFSGQCPPSSRKDLNVTPILQQFPTNLPPGVNKTSTCCRLYFHFHASQHRPTYPHTKRYDSLTPAGSLSEMVSHESSHTSQHRPTYPHTKRYDSLTPAGSLSEMVSHESSHTSQHRPTYPHTKRYDSLTPAVSLREMVSHESSHTSPSAPLLYYVMTYVCECSHG